MLKTTFFSVIFFATLFTGDNDYIPADDGSSVKFKIKNLGINVDGSFKGLKGNIFFDAANASATKIDVTVDANTINTGIQMRDNHLRKPEYFDVLTYPLIRFVSVTVASAGNGKYNVTGKLTIKNTTKLISFVFTAVPKDAGMLFTGMYKINRRDYDIGGRSLTLSDNLEINLTVFAKK